MDARPSLLSAISRGVGPTVAACWSRGARHLGTFPVETATVGDTDKANTGRGAAVLTFKILLPPGLPWEEFDEVELVTHDGPIDRVKMKEPVRVSQIHPVVVYLNLSLRRAL